MTWMTRNNPLSDFRTLQARAFEPFFGRFNFLDDSLASGTWAPPVDVAEDNEKIHVKVEVPGMDESPSRAAEPSARSRIFAMMRAKRL